MWPIQVSSKYVCYCTKQIKLIKCASARVFKTSYRTPLGSPWDCQKGSVHTVSANFSLYKSVSGQLSS